MKTQVLNTYAMTLDEARKLIDGVPCERCAEGPYAGAKHPGWVLGHLAGASVMAGKVLGADLGEFEPWMMAAMKDPTTDRAAYGKKEEMVRALERAHAATAAAFARASDAALAAPYPEEKYRSFWPTVADGMFYLLAYHEGYHLGQLSAWRRAAGFGPAAG